MFVTALAVGGYVFWIAVILTFAVREASKENP